MKILIGVVATLMVCFCSSQLNYFNKAKRKNKMIFIYDEVGKQVRWLQYALEKANVKNYYFMHNGARGYYDIMAKIAWPDK